MKHVPMGRTARGQLRLVYSDRVVSRSLGPDATLADVADLLGELSPRYFGHPVMIDVTMTDSSKRLPASHFMPAGMTYEDDLAAEFEEAMSRAPDFTAQFRA